MKIPIKKATIGIIIVLIALLVGARLYLPYWLEDYVNRQIAALEGYDGSVKDIDVSLWRGAYQIKDINIYKKNHSPKNPFFAAEIVDLSVEWNALFKGGIVAEIDVYEGNLNFSRSQTGEGADWPRFVDTLSPLEINRFDIHSGKIAYVDYNATPNVNIYIHNVNAQVKNLRQVTSEDKKLPSPVNISGTSVGKGKLSIVGNMNILRDVPDFDLNGELENAFMPAFNSYTKSFAGIDFESGNLSIYTELAAADGKVVGYIKPIAKDVSLNPGGSNPINAIWESLVSVFMEIFKNHPRDQFAMRIPIAGSLNNPDQNNWAAFLSIFQNAFGKAFVRDTDGNISLNDALLENTKE